MAYICEEELRTIYYSLEPRFLELGFDPEIALVRDYLLKIKISVNEASLGKLIIDYSPKKQSHNFRRDSDMTEEQFKRILDLLGAEAQIKTKSNSESKNSPKSKAVFSYNVLTQYSAFVDGSFINGCTGFGAVILKGSDIEAELSGKVDSPEAFNSRQVAGEIQAVIEVLEWCKGNNISEITIFYDFQNIEKWATGKFRTNTPMTQAYKEYIDNSKVKVTWVKVESHTGVELNDRADILAKNGAMS